MERAKIHKREGKWKEKSNWIKKIEQRNRRKNGTWEEYYNT